MRARLLAAAIALCVSRAGEAQSGSTPPSITRVAIANGSFNTGERTVTLNLSVQGSPTAYRASEKSDMSGVLWRTFTTSPSFTLSSEPGRKVVFVQVGRAPTISTDISRTTSTTLTRTIDYVPTPTSLSSIASDTIVLGLPDLRSTVTMPATVRNNTSFSFTVTITNAGQRTPPGEIIRVYNSFVTNTISVEGVEVNFMMQNLVGDGCTFPDVPTIECTLAPMIAGHAIAINIRARVMNGLSSGQTQVTHTLRTRITGIRESNTTNNWRDTPITIVR
jgi:hypothetical protein